MCIIFFFSKQLSISKPSKMSHFGHQFEFKLVKACSSSQIILNTERLGDLFCRKGCVSICLQTNPMRKSFFKERIFLQYSVYLQCDLMSDFQTRYVHSNLSLSFLKNDLNEHLMSIKASFRSFTSFAHYFRVVSR